MFPKTALFNSDAPIYLFPTGINISFEVTVFSITGLYDVVDYDNSCKLWCSGIWTLRQSQIDNFGWSSDYRTVVEHTPYNHEVMGYYPTRCWAFLKYLNFHVFFITCYNLVHLFSLGQSHKKRRPSCALGCARSKFAWMSKKASAEKVKNSKFWKLSYGVIAPLPVKIPA